MFGRMKDAVADAAETLRRAFAGLQVVAIMPEPFQLVTRKGEGWSVTPRSGLEVPSAGLRAMSLFREVVQSRGLEPFTACLQAEAGWARWGAEAQVLGMAPLKAASASRMEVPSLPRKARVLGRVEAPARPGTRRWAEPALKAAVRREEPGLDAPGCRPGLLAMLTLAVPIQREDIQRLPKGLWMRYSLRLVRGTGENVRNLEILGLFMIPRKGVADLRHDPRQGRILLKLDLAALRSARSPFILAKRKDDGALVSCFVEEP